MAQKKAAEKDGAGVSDGMFRLLFPHHGRTMYHNAINPPPFAADPRPAAEGRPGVPYASYVASRSGARSFRRRMAKKTKHMMICESVEIGTLRPMAKSVPNLTLMK